MIEALVRAPAIAGDIERRRAYERMWPAHRQRFPTRGRELDHELWRAAYDDVVSPAPVAIEPAERRTLRARIDELEAMIREGNEERNQLRRALAEREPSAIEPISARGTDPDDDPPGDEGEAATARIRRALVPHVGRAVADAMREVPPHVAAEAMRTVGQLAAGDVAAWRGVA